MLHAETQHFVHLFLLDGLGEIVLRSQAHGLCNFAGVANAGDHHHPTERTRFTDALQGFEPIPTGHNQIQEDHVRRLLPDLSERFLAAGSGAYLVGVEFE